MSMKKLSLPVLALVALAFAGCSTTGTKDEGAAKVDDRSTESAGPRTAPATDASTWGGHPLDDPNSILHGKTVYFDFDKSDIRPEFVDMLKAHATYMLRNPSVTVVIEGHCDERGSREYNIGLGERRSSAVKRFLEAEGVDPAQLSMVSYGEERPADPGHNEAAWAMNRRGVLVYNR